MAGRRDGGIVMGAMTEAAQQYLRLRRALGYELEEPGRLVLAFAGHLDGLGVALVTADAAAEWATAPQGTEPYWHWLRMSALRGFAIYLHSLDPRHQVPPSDMLPRHYTRPAPYLFSEDEIAALIRAAGRMRHGPAVTATYQTLIALLAVTGMRPGEACQLDRDHFSPRDRTLTIVRSKFGKTRQLLLDPTTVTALEEYGRHRDRLHPHPAEPSLLVSMQGTRMDIIPTERVFARLARAAGIQPLSTRTRPRMKDLRHTFAVSTLISWYQSGADVEARLPALSAWLGHVDPRASYWYLQASPELLALAARRAEKGRHSQEEPS
jgi:integrase/recombinase XerD